MPFRHPRLAGVFHRRTAILASSGFATRSGQFACWPALFMTFSRSTRRVAASFLARKLVDCCLMWRYLLACLFLQLPFFIRLLAMFGPWSPNGYLLASIPPLGDIYIYLFLSACSPCLGPGLRMAICLCRFHLSAIYIYILSACSSCLGPGFRTAICCVDSASRRYIYIYIYLSACSPWLGPGLRTTILRRIHYSALRPAPSWRYSFGLAASLAPSRQNRQFYFSYAPSRQHRFSIRLTADVVFITLPPPRGDISFSPHGANQFSLRLILPTRWFAPLGGL